jgi:hypothetical protein
MEGLEYDKEKYPDTGYLTNLAITVYPGLDWYKKVFRLAENGVKSGQWKESEIFQSIKDHLSRYYPSERGIRNGTIDWCALFNYISNKSRPENDKDWSPLLIIREQTYYQMNHVPQENKLENETTTDNKLSQEFKDKNITSTPPPFPKARIIQQVPFKDKLRFIVSVSVIILFLGGLAVISLPYIIQFGPSVIGGFIIICIVGVLVLGGLGLLGNGIDAIFNTKQARVSSYSPKYPENWNEIRKEVLKRDGNRCANCGSKVNLHIHHIVSLKDHGSNNIDNLKTVCKNCHEKIHPFMKDYD